MDRTLTGGEKRRLVGLERRRERQIKQAKQRNGGKYSNRLKKTLRAIAELRARQARRRLDFTHKLTTDLAKSHGLVAIEDLRVRQMTKSAKGTRPAWNPCRPEVRSEPGRSRQHAGGTPTPARLQVPRLRIRPRPGAARRNLADVRRLPCPRRCITRQP